MAWTRHRNEPCTYNADLTQSTNELSYRLDPNKFYNCNECRIPFGLYGGNNVSINTSDLVGLERKLQFNNDQHLTRCPEKKYLPQCCDCDPNYTGGIPCGSLSCRMGGHQDAANKHLSECNIIQYAPRVNHTGFNLNYPGCQMYGYSTNGQKMIHPPHFNPIKSYQGQQGSQPVCK